MESTTTQPCPQLVQEIYDIVSKQRYLRESERPDPERGNSLEAIRFWRKSRVSKIEVAQESTLSGLNLHLALTRHNSQDIPIEAAEAAIKQAYQQLKDETKALYDKLIGEHQNA